MIEEFSFGKIVIDGVSYTGDIKIIQNKVIPNWWRKSGHLVEIEDVKDIIEDKTDTLLIGKGQPGQMESSKKLREFLRKNGIELIEENTPKAIEIYNRLLKEGKKVSAGFHLTC